MNQNDKTWSFQCYFCSGHLQPCVFQLCAASETYKVAFWMRKFAAMSWKRTWVWSVSRKISCLDLGKLTRQEKAGCQRTTTRYRDAKGKLRFKGNSNLKKSQCLPSLVRFFFRSFCKILFRFMCSNESHAPWPTSKHFPRYDISLPAAVTNVILT